MSYNVEMYDEEATDICRSFLNRFPHLFSDFDLQETMLDFENGLLVASANADARFDFVGATMMVMKGCVIAVANGIPSDIVARAIESRRKIMNYSGVDAGVFDEMGVIPAAFDYIGASLAESGKEYYIRNRLWNMSNADMIMATVLSGLTTAIMIGAARGDKTPAEYVAMAETAMSMRNTFIGKNNALLEYNVYTMNTPDGIRNVPFSIIPAVLVDLIHLINHDGGYVGDSIAKLFEMIGNKNGDDDLSDLFNPDAMQFLRGIGGKL